MAIFTEKLIRLVLSACRMGIPGDCSKNIHYKHHPAQDRDSAPSYLEGALVACVPRGAATSLCLLGWEQSGWGTLSQHKVLGEGSRV